MPGHPTRRELTHPPRPPGHGEINLSSFGSPAGPRHPGLIPCALWQPSRLSSTHATFGLTRRFRRSAIAEAGARPAPLERVACSPQTLGSPPRTPKSQSTRAASPPTPQVRSYLMAISGISGKSVACLLLYRMRRIAFAVDANVLRLMTRLGWLKKLGIMPVEGLATSDRKAVLRLGLLPPPPHPRKGAGSAPVLAQRDSRFDVVAVGLAVEAGSGRVVLCLRPMASLPRLDMCITPVRPAPALTYKPRAPGGTKKRRCGTCTTCVAPNCGSCSKCRDMPAFGGPGRLRQSCDSRRCLMPMMPPPAVQAELDGPQALAYASEAGGPREGAADVRDGPRTSFAQVVAAARSVFAGPSLAPSHAQPSAHPHPPPSASCLLPATAPHHAATGQQSQGLSQQHQPRPQEPTIWPQLPPSPQSHALLSPPVGLSGMGPPPPTPPASPPPPSSPPLPFSPAPLSSSWHVATSAPPPHEAERAPIAASAPLGVLPTPSDEDQVMREAIAEAVQGMPTSEARPSTPNTSGVPIACGISPFTLTAPPDDFDVSLPVEMVPQLAPESQQERAPTGNGAGLLVVVSAAAGTAAAAADPDMTPGDTRGAIFTADRSDEPLLCEEAIIDTSSLAAAAAPAAASIDMGSNAWHAAPNSAALRMSGASKMYCRQHAVYHVCNWTRQRAMELAAAAAAAPSDSAGAGDPVRGSVPPARRSASGGAGDVEDLHKQPLPNIKRFSVRAQQYMQEVLPADDDDTIPATEKEELQELLYLAHVYMITHGAVICGETPNCGQCPLQPSCEYGTLLKAGAIGGLGEACRPNGEGGAGRTIAPGGAVGSTGEPPRDDGAGRPAVSGAADRSGEGSILNAGKAPARSADSGREGGAVSSAEAVGEGSVAGVAQGGGEAIAASGAEGGGEINGVRGAEAGGEASAASGAEDDGAGSGISCAKAGGAASAGNVGDADEAVSGARGAGAGDAEPADGSMEDVAETAHSAVRPSAERVAEGAPHPPSIAPDGGLDAKELAELAEVARGGGDANCQLAHAREVLDASYAPRHPGDETPRLLLVKSTIGDHAKGRLLVSPWSAFKGVFPMQGTYFFQNEVFEDESAGEVAVPLRCLGELRPVYVGKSIEGVLRHRRARELQLLFRRGYVCIRRFRSAGCRLLPLVLDPPRLLKYNASPSGVALQCGLQSQADAEAAQAAAAASLASQGGADPLLDAMEEETASDDPAAAEVGVSARRRGLRLFSLYLAAGGALCMRETVWRRLVLALHPDRGGDVATFQLVGELKRLVDLGELLTDSARREMDAACLSPLDGPAAAVAARLEADIRARAIELGLPLPPGIAPEPAATADQDPAHDVGTRSPALETSEPPAKPTADAEAASPEVLQPASVLHVQMAVTVGVVADVVVEICSL